LTKIKKEIVYRYKTDIFSAVFLFKHQRNSFFIVTFFINKKRCENKKTLKTRFFILKQKT